MPRVPVAERRSRLLDAAFAVIARGGVGAATTRAVVQEAGMKLASFHYAFRSREQLLGELVEVVVGAQESVLDLPTDAGSGLAEVIELGLLGYFEQVRADPARERAMFELTQYAMRTPGLEGLAERQYERYRALARASLLEAAERSGCSWPAPEGPPAGELVALTDGITLAWLADGDTARAHRALAFAARALAAESVPSTSPAAPVRTSPSTRGTTHE
ncbi:MAG: TetR family transcriptional regulator [Herbiconiux sp.]|nr:TetR family transcriptional regulator [Herbiconiux sp.]